MKTMKIWRIAFAMLAVFSLASCSSDNEDEDNTVSYVEVYYSIETSDALRSHTKLTYEWFSDNGERKKIYIQQLGTTSMHGSVKFDKFPAHCGFRITPSFKEDEQSLIDGTMTYEAIMKPTIYYQSGRKEELSPTVSSFYAESSDAGWYTLLQLECRQTGLVQSIDKNGSRSQDTNYVW